MEMLAYSALGALLAGLPLLWLWLRAEARAQELAVRLAEITGREGAVSTALPEKFHTLADAALSTALSRQQDSLGALIQPMRETLAKLDTDIQQRDTRLTADLARLSQETQKLTQALRHPGARGRLLETQLRRVLELSGLEAQVDFQEQVQAEQDGRTLRPDLVVHLPAGRQIIIDAKAPQDALDTALAASDEPTRRAALEKHAQHLRQHVQTLASKAYWDSVAGAADFVVLFLPDAALAAALEVDAALPEDAAQRRVILTTPTNLIALLRVVALGWRQTRLGAEAENIRKHGRELHQRLSKFCDDFQKIGRGLGAVVNAFNSAAGSLESRLLVSARRFDALGEGEIAAPDALTTQPRTLNVPELEPEREKEPSSRPLPPPEKAA